MQLDQPRKKQHLHPLTSQERLTYSKFRAIKEKKCLKSEIKKDSFEDHGTRYQWLRKGALYV